jgi:hypothetical protein
LTHRRPYDIEDKSYYDTASAIATKRALGYIPAELARVLQLPPGPKGISKLVTNAELVTPPGTVVPTAGDLQLTGRPHERTAHTHLDQPLGVRVPSDA